MSSVLITGANRGLGLEFTRQYLNDGWEVHAFCRQPDKAAELGEIVTHKNGKLHLRQMDIDNENEIKKDLMIASPDRVGNNYQESLQYPSLNIRGLNSGWVKKEARTIIPDQAIAEIDVRLVKESDPHRLIKLIKNHIIKQGAYVIENRDPTEEERLENSNIIRFDSKVSYLAFRTEIDSPIGNWASSALKKAFGRTPIKIRTSGGSIPISPFVTILDVPALTYPSVNKDNNQHSPNENIKIGNFIDGTLGMVYLLLEKIN